MTWHAFYATIPTDRAGVTWGMPRPIGVPAVYVLPPLCAGGMTE